MITLFILIGIIVGLLLGIAGAGGGIIAVPLFVFMLDLSVHDATTLSLVVVFSGAIMNWFFQRKNTQYKISALIFLFSFIGATLFKPVKELVPEWFILTIFAIICFLSLVSIWKKLELKTQTHSFVMKGAIGGFTLGSLVMMTGISGGIILIPLLTGFFLLPMNQASATSLFTITMTSLFSLLIQHEVVSEQLNFFRVLGLAGGTMVAAIVAKKLVQNLPQNTLDRIRKILISWVIVTAVLTLVLLKR